MKHLKGYVAISAAACLWGIAATVAKILFNKQYEPLILVQMRVTISFAVLFLFFLFYNRRLLIFRVKDIPLFFTAGILGVAGSNYFYYAAIKETNVSTSILLQYTAPVMVMLYVTVIQKEKITVAKISALLLSVIGIFLAIGAYDPDLFGSAALFWIFISTPADIAAAKYSLEDWGVFVTIAVLSILLPYSLYYYGLHHIQSSKAIIISTLEPVVAIVSEWLFLGGTMGPIQFLGAVFVLVAIVVLQRNSRDQEPIMVQE